MEELITEFKETGPCTVDVAKVAAAWNDKFSISQWKEEYRLIEQIELFKEPCYKVTISKEQALDIIQKIKLLPIISTVFNSAITWRSRLNISSEKERIGKIIYNKIGEVSQEELSSLMSIFVSYEAALEKKENDIQFYIKS